MEVKYLLLFVGRIVIVSLKSIYIIQDWTCNLLELMKVNYVLYTQAQNNNTFEQTSSVLI